MVTYNSGADRHYLSEADRHTAGLLILKPYTKRGGVTRLPFPTLSPRATQADSINDFPHSLMSVGKTSDDKTVSIFTWDGVTVHAEEDILITCQGVPILIGVRDTHGRYRIPLVQTQGQWQPCHPSKRAQADLHKANSVYDLPSTKQAIKWLHAVCGYPVKSTWIKAIKAGNFHGWPLLSATNVFKYYRKSLKHPKGTSTRPAKMFAPPNQSTHLRNSTPTNSGATKNATAIPKRTTPERPSSPTKQAKSPPAPRPAINTS